MKIVQSIPAVVMEGYTFKVRVTTNFPVQFLHQESVQYSTCTAVFEI